MTGLANITFLYNLYSRVFSSFFSVFYVSLSSMITDEGSLNVCAGADRGCSHYTGTGAGSCRRRITGRKMTVVVEVTTRG